MAWSWWKRAASAAALPAALLAACGAPEPRDAAAAVVADGPPALHVPYVPSPMAVVETMLEMAEVGTGDFVVDLGSGDGRILVAAARERGARGLGVDLDPERIAEAEENAREAGVADRIRFRRRDLFETPIREASVVTMYLLSDINLRLRPRLLGELRPGTRIVSHAFDMDDWEPDRTEMVETAAVHLWLVPARAEGRWRLNDGGQPALLTLSQRFQMLEGTLRRDEREWALSGGRIEGERIRFSAGGRAYEGLVRGGAIEGVGWRAERAGGS